MSFQPFQPAFQPHALHVFSACLFSLALHVFSALSFQPFQPFQPRAACPFSLGGKLTTLCMSSQPES
jgi:hypothetical protein